MLVVLAIYLLVRVLFRGSDPEFRYWYLWILPFFCIVSIPLIYLVILIVFFMGGFSVISPKRRWLKRATHAKAIIVDKRMREESEDRYDYSYDFYIPELKLKYAPTLAINNSSEQAFWASIPSSIYEKYELDDTVDIFYSITDPSLFLIEGE